jgi:hypothetical protein
MGPVVDPRHHEAEKNQSDGPSHDLAVDDVPVKAPPAFPVVEGGADQTADACRRPMVKGMPASQETRNPENAAPGIHEKEAVEAVFAENEGTGAGERRAC